MKREIIANEVLLAVIKIILLWPGQNREDLIALLDFHVFGMKMSVENNKLKLSFCYSISAIFSTCWTHNLALGKKVKVEQSKWKKSIFSKYLINMCLFTNEQTIDNFYLRIMFFGTCFADESHKLKYWGHLISSGWCIWK